MVFVTIVIYYLILPKNHFLIMGYFEVSNFQNFVFYYSCVEINLFTNNHSHTVKMAVQAHSKPSEMLTHFEGVS